MCLALSQSLPASLINLTVNMLSLQQCSHQRSLALIMLTLIALLVESMEKDSGTQQADQLLYKLFNLGFQESGFLVRQQRTWGYMATFLN